MRKRFSALLLISFLFSVLCMRSQPSIEWQKSFGGSDNDYAQSIQQTPDNGFIIAGYSLSINGDITGHHSGSSPFNDYWIVKTDSVGSIQWQKSLGGFGDDFAYSIRNTADGGYIVIGATASNNGDVTGLHNGFDYWIVKLSSIGNIQWKKCLGGSVNDFGYSIEQSSDGGYIVAGSAASPDGNVIGVHGMNDYWVVKLSNLGAIQWQRTYGGSNNDYAKSIQQTTDGGYIVAGYSDSNNGDVTGNHGYSDYWIVKLDSGGVIQWQKSLGGTSYDYAESIQQTTDGGYIVAGHSESNNGDVTGNHGYSDYWIVKLDTSGTIQWQKSLGGSDNDYGYSVQQTYDGEYIVVGASASNDGDVISNIGGDGDYWIIKLSSAGAVTWQKSYGGTLSDHGYSIQQTTDGGYIIAGDSDSNNADVTGNHGSKDYWIIKLSCSPPNSNFSVSVSDPCIGTNINFTNTTTGLTTSFQWQINGSNFSNASSPSYIFGADGTYTISLISMAGACSDTSTQIIVVRPSPISNFSGLNSNFCINASPINLTGSPSGGIFSGNGISGNTFDPTNSGVGTHSIIYTITDTNGCIGTSSQSVIINPLPTVSFTGLNATYCSNASTVNLIGIPNGGVFSGSGISGSTFVPSAANAGTDSITYFYTDGNGCSNNTIETTTVNVIPVVSFSGLLSDYCINSSSSNLSGNPAGGTFSGNGMAGNIFNPTTAGSGTNSVMYAFTDNNGCSNADTQQVIIHSLPVVNFLGLNNNYCVNASSSNLSGSPAGGVFSGSGVSGNSFIPSSSNIGSNDITYNYIDVNGCSNSIFQTTNIIPLPNVSISGTSPVCAGDIETLTAAGIGNMLWNNGDTSRIISAMLTGTTLYSVTASNSCGSVIDSILITVNQLPVTTISNDTTIFMGSSANVHATGGTLYSWVPATGLSCTSCPDPVASPQSTTVYSVTATGSNGCSATNSITVTVTDESEVFVPDIFSPNNDGQNDMLYVRGPGIKELNFTVFDRLGEKIFETNDLTKGWDGTYKGSALNSAVFVYYLSATLINDKKIKTKGDITLIR